MTITQTDHRNADDRLLTIAQAAAFPGAPSEDTIRRHIRKGAITVVRVGPFRRIRIRVATFQAYLGLRADGPT